MSIEKKNCLSGIDKRRNRNGFFSSEEIVASLGDKAEMKGKLSFVRLCILGIMAGFVLHWVTWRLFVSLELPHRMGKF